MIYCFVSNAIGQVKTTDSVFVRGSRPIQFVVGTTNLSDADRRWIADTLRPALQALGDRGIVLGRSAASPEGPVAGNLRLANGRLQAVTRQLGSFGIRPDRIHYDVVTEDYGLLHSLMKLGHDSYFLVVDSLMERYADNDSRLKAAMMNYDGGRLWKYLLRRYFPRLRAVRIMAIDQSLVDHPMPSCTSAVLSAAPLVPVEPWRIPRLSTLEVAGWQSRLREPRRELLSVKTNLLFDFAYVPGYNRFCPIPNVAVELYPYHGHFTFGASFDGPWWQHYADHRYFQVRNYQLFTRYYLRSGDILYRRPGSGAAFKGFYVGAYAHAGIYNICFGEKRGWEGEGWGAGLGIGHVLPLGRTEHWRLEFGLQAGFFTTNYDPYQWRCPVKPDTDPEQYYYKWYGNASDFRKRRHRYSWLGPTRLEVTLSYDLLYHRNHRKGVSFRSYEPQKQKQR